MKNTLLNLSDHKGCPLVVDAGISFGPFISYLRKKVDEEHTVKGALYQNALREFEKQDLENAEIQIEDMDKYELLLEHMYACLSPAAVSEDQFVWGLCFPLQPITFYGTNLMYQMLESKLKDKDAYVTNKTPEEHLKERLNMVYTFILKELYNFRPPLRTHQFQAGMKKDDGLQGFFHVSINTDFIRVMAKKELPKLSYRELQQFLTDESGLEKLQVILPLDLFEFRGISVLNITDVTAQQAIDNIRNVRLSRSPEAGEVSYTEVIQSLKTLVQDSEIQFDLFPFVRINSKMVYGYVKGGSGVLFSVWGDERLSPEAFQQVAEAYASNPNSFFSPDIHAEDPQLFSWLEPFKKLGVRSIALMPVFHNHQLVGVLGMHTWMNKSFDERTLALLEPAIAPVAQLLQVYIDEFNLEIENIIKEKYTSIQPSVQWKFNEAAWHHLHEKKKNLPASNESINFLNVYPFYGAIDIRNSTAERNTASKADLSLHLSMLHETLLAIKEAHHSALMDEMLFNCGKWKQILQQADQLNTTDENNLNIFLKENTKDYLQLVAQTQPKTQKVIESYLKVISASNGEVYKNRQSLEVSMQMINSAINNYFEAEKEKLQESYPCYFEKFRTDGVEYDIYIGQSIAPEKVFNHFHLRNLRLWQLSSMAAIAKMIRQLQPSMPVKLSTTHLIFIHNHTIDISFRADERKFDVEGAYNIRYQMIKKRIDKVLIRNTGERLTQPDKLGLIYFNKRDIEDYLPFVTYLQETGVLHSETEDLDLEDLQGLSGLKALRVTIL